MLTTPLPACTKCGHIDRISPATTYHELFGLPSETNPFVVDTQALSKAFRNAQRVVHPDLWASRGPERQQQAESVSSLVNHAYRTLQDPLLRAEYILQQNGVEVSETEQLDDPELIMAIMEAREELESAEDAAQVEELRSANQEKSSEVERDLTRLIFEKSWNEVKSSAIKLRYLRGIDIAAKAWPSAAPSTH